MFAALPESSAVTGLAIAGTSENNSIETSSKLARYWVCLGPFRRGSMNPGRGRPMKRLWTNARFHYAFTKVDASAPQLTHVLTLHTEWYLAPQEGHPSIPERIGCRHEKHGVVTCCA